MKTLQRGEHTTFESKSGTRYWVMNCNGRYHVRKIPTYKVVEATKEIKEMIKLA